MCCQPTESSRVFAASVRLQTDVRLADTIYSATGNRDLGEERQTQSWSSFCSQKSCAASKAAVGPKKLAVPEVLLGMSTKCLWLFKSCPILGTSVSINPYKISWVTAIIPLFQRNSSQRTKPLLENNQHIYNFSKGIWLTERKRKELNRSVCYGTMCKKW